MAVTVADTLVGAEDALGVGDAFRARRVAQNVGDARRAILHAPGALLDFVHQDPVGEPVFGASQTATEQETAMTGEQPATSKIGPAAVAYTMIRVRNLEASLAFYVEALGMTLLHREDFPAGRFTLAFVGYLIPGVERPVTIELTHNWEAPNTYTHGSGFGHIALRAPDVYAATAALAARGVKVARPAGPMKSSTPTATGSSL